MVRISLPLAVPRSKTQAGMGENAHLPAVKVIERLHEILGASSPAR